MLGVLEVVWEHFRCTGCSGGVLDTDTSVLDTDISVLDTDTSALDWTYRSKRLDWASNELDRAQAQANAGWIEPGSKKQKWPF